MGSKTRVLHLLKSLNIGGAEKSTIFYCNSLQNRIDFVGLFASEGFYNHSDMIDKNVKIFSPPKSVNNFYFAYRNFVFLNKIIAEFSITHIHYHQRIFIPFIILIKIFNPGVKIVYSHHNCFKDFINYFIPADKIIAFNQSLKDDLPCFLKKKVSIIMHGFKKLKINVEPKSKVQNIGYVGRFTEFKRINELISAFAVISKSFPDTKLVLVGEGELKKQLVELSLKLKLNKRIVFLQPAASEEEIYKNIDLIVLPSKTTEGFGLVIFEAMGRGIPSLTRELNIYTDVLRNDYNCKFFSNNLTIKLMELLSESNEYKTLSENCISDYQKLQSIDNVVNEYLENIYI